jgi:hypothetical protein
MEESDNKPKNHKLRILVRRSASSGFSDTHTHDIRKYAQGEEMYQRYINIPKDQDIQTVYLQLMDDQNNYKTFIFDTLHDVSGVADSILPQNGKWHDVSSRASPRHHDVVEWPISADTHANILADVVSEKQPYYHTLKNNCSQMTTQLAARYVQLPDLDTATPNRLGKSIERLVDKRHAIKFSSSIIPDSSFQTLFAKDTNSGHSARSFREQVWNHSLASSKPSVREEKTHVLRLLIKRPSWGYSKEDIALMTREEKFQHIYNPLHDAGILGGIYMQLETPDGESDTYIFGPRKKSLIAQMASTTAIKAVTAFALPIDYFLPYLGKIYTKKSTVFYDDEIEYNITISQYDGIKNELSSGKTSLFNYCVHDSGLYATRLAARYGVSVPDLGLLTPLEFYRTAATHLPYAIPLHSKIFPRQDIITIFPRELTGAYGGANNGRIKPFVQRVEEGRDFNEVQRLSKIAGGIC